MLFIRLSGLLADWLLPGVTSYNRLMKGLKKVKLLILEDWGINNSNPVAGRNILEVIEDRNQINSTVILSRLSIADWHSLFSEPNAADSVMDRLIYGSHIIGLVADNFMRKLNGKEFRPRAIKEAASGNLRRSRRGMGVYY